MDIYQASQLYTAQFRGFNCQTGVPSADACARAMDDLVALAKLSSLPADGRLRYLDQLVGEMAAVAPTSALLFNQTIVENPEQKEFAKTLEIALAAMAERSPETWQHIGHHTSLTMQYYERQNGITEGNVPNPQELLTLLVGALGHDFGKIGIDPQLLHKSARVDPQHFAIVLKNYQQYVPNYPEKLHDMIFLVEANKGSIIFTEPATSATAADPVILDIGKDLHHSERYWLDNAHQQQHNAIWERIHTHAKFIPPDNNNWFSDAEQLALTMPERGTVTSEEMRVIASHDTMSAEFFKHAPLPADLEGVRDIVSMDRFRDPQSAPQTMAPLADIIHTTDVFEALTGDRSYRKAYSPEEALTVMEGMGEEGKVNSTLVASMRDNGTVNAYSQAMDLQHSVDIAPKQQAQPSWVERIFGFDPVAALFPSWADSVRTTSVRTNRL